MSMIRTNKAMPKSYWGTGYLIPFNTPRFRYRPFQSLQEILENQTLNNQPNDYIFRVSSNGIYIYYRYSDDQKWLRRPEIKEYDRNVKYKKLKYMQ